MGTTTTNLGFYKPAIGETGWGTLVDDIFDAIDAAVMASVMYVTTAGSDSNSGLTLGDAKLTIGAAITALPSTGGTVFYESGVYAQADHTKGLWFTNSGASGYIQDKHLSVVALGVSSTANTGLQAGYPQGIVNGPAVMLKWDYFSSTVQHFVGMSINNSDVCVRMGVTDAGVRTTTGCQNKYFEGCGFRVAQSAGKGPVWDIGSNVFWIWANNCVIIGNEQESHTTDLRAGVLLDPGASSTPGLIFMDGVTFGGGAGVRMRPGPTGGVRLTMRNITTEGTTGGADGAGSQQPALDLVDGTVNGSPSYAGSVIIDSVTTADAAHAQPAVRIYSGVKPDVVLVNGVDTVQGPCTNLGVSGFGQGASDGTNPNTAREQRQRGFGRNNHFVGQVDVARQQSPLSAVPHVNLAPQDTSTWGSKTGTATVTTGQADKFGGTGAAKLSSASGNLNRQIYRATRAVSVGDWFIGGVWMRIETANADLQSGCGLSISTAGGTGTTTAVEKIKITSVAPRQQWMWVPVASKLTAAGTNPEIIFALGVDTTTAIHYFLPVFCHILAASSLSDAEVYERVDQLGTWSENVTVGDIGIPKGMALSLNGVRVVTGTLTPEGAVTAPPGSLFLRTDGGASTSLYVKTSGTGNTGWTAK